MVSDYQTIFLSDAFRPETFDIHNICLCLVRPTGFEPVTHALLYKVESNHKSREVALFNL